MITGGKSEEKANCHLPSFTLFTYRGPKMSNCGLLECMLMIALTSALHWEK